MLPGDMIEWVYVDTGDVVDINEKLWSCTMSTWAPVGRPSLLISIDEKIYSWLTSIGIFHALMSDVYSEGVCTESSCHIYPRKIEARFNT
jgi:hypothetical protein